MSQPGLDLRPLIAQAVREVVAEMVGESLAGRGSSTPVPARPAAETSAVESSAPGSSSGVAGSEFVAERHPRTRTETVRLSDDGELGAFVRHLLALFENPKNRQDLRAGRLRFHLSGGTSTRGTAPAMLITGGAVTERRVSAAHAEGKRIVLGRGAVLTPLGRERARALGVDIEKER